MSAVEEYREWSLPFVPEPPPAVSDYKLGYRRGVIACAEYADDAIAEIEDEVGDEWWARAEQDMERIANLEAERDALRCRYCEDCGNANGQDAWDHIFCTEGVDKAQVGFACNRWQPREGDAVTPDVRPMSSRR